LNRDQKKIRASLGWQRARNLHAQVFKFNFLMGKEKTSAWKGAKKKRYAGESPPLGK